MAIAPAFRSVSQNFTPDSNQRSLTAFQCNLRSIRPRGMIFSEDQKRRANGSPLCALCASVVNSSRCSRWLYRSVVNQRPCASMAAAASKAQQIGRPDRSPLHFLRVLCVFVVNCSLCPLRLGGESTPMRVHGRHRRYGHNILDIVPRLQDMHRRAHAQQNRAYRLGLGQPREQLVRRIGRVQIGGKTSTLASRTWLKG